MHKQTKFGIFLMTLFAVFMSWFLYINEPIGDDVAGVFSGSITAYLDDYEITLGERITSLKQVGDILTFIYKHWSGRMPGYFMANVLVLFPKYAQSIIIALIYCGICIFSLRLVYGTIKNTFEHSLSIILLILVVYWYKTSVFYTYMRTMAAIYSFPVLLALFYINFYEENKSKYSKLLLQILGLIVGWAHEVISLLVIIVISMSLLQKYFTDKNTKISFWNHIGLIVGYILCFTAPGNFSRITESHDKVSIGIIKRIFVSGYNHIVVLAGNPVSRCILLSVIIFTLICFIRFVKHNSSNTYVRAILDVLSISLPYVVACIFSILIWGVFPHTASYGLDIFLIFAYVILFKTIDFTGNANFFRCISLTAFILLAFVFANMSEVKSIYTTATLRRRLIKEAVSNQEQVVHVPAHDEKKLSRDRYFMKYLNEQETYNDIFYIGYFGTRVIIDS